MRRPAEPYQPTHEPTLPYTRPPLFPSLRSTYPSTRRAKGATLLYSASICMICRDLVQRGVRTAEDGVGLQHEARKVAHLQRARAMGDIRSASRAHAHAHAHAHANFARRQSPLVELPVPCAADTCRPAEQHVRHVADGHEEPDARRPGAAELLGRRRAIRLGGCGLRRAPGGVVDVGHAWAGRGAASAAKVRSG